MGGCRREVLCFSGRVSGRGLIYDSAFLGRTRREREYRRPKARLLTSLLDLLRHFQWGLLLFGLGLGIFGQTVGFSLVVDRAFRFGRFLIQITLDGIEDAVDELRSFVS